jgi:ATP-binding cassette, subfamily B, bacterial
MQGQYRVLLWQYLVPQWPKVMLLALLLIGNIALQLANPQIVRAFLDAALAGQPLDALLRLGLLFLALGAIDQLLGVCVVYLGEDVGWTATNRLRAELTLRCLNLDMGFHNARTPGELIERIDGDATAVSNFFSQFILQIVGSLLMLFGVLVLLFREDWRAGTALSLFAAVGLLVLNRFRSLAVPATKEERKASASFFSFLEERLAGLDDLRANGGGAYVMRRFDQVMGDLATKGRRAWMGRGYLWGITLTMIAVGYVIAFGMGAYLYSLGSITLGTVYLFYQYSELIQTPLEQLTRQLQDLQKAAASLSRIADLNAIESQLQDGSGGQLPNVGALSVDFDAVSFAYNPEATILKDFSLNLQPREVLGLLGRTGSGKSTLTRLLLRLYDPSAGTVRLGGVDLRTLSQEAIRSQIAMVTQEVQLFRGTVRDNLTFFDGTIPDVQLIAALESAELGEWFHGLPEGLDTELAAGGKGLSGGEAQLLAFARVLLKDPGLVILDEPSSRLDPATEQRIERAISRLLAGRTAIIIAHRLGTVQRVDTIAILEDGRLIEHGDRLALKQSPNSRFADLLKSDLQEVLR